MSLTLRGRFWAKAGEPSIRADSVKVATADFIPLTPDSQRPTPKHPGLGAGGWKVEVYRGSVPPPAWGPGEIARRADGGPSGLRHDRIVPPWRACCQRGSDRWSRVSIAR